MKQRSGPLSIFSFFLVEVIIISDKSLIILMIELRKNIKPDTIHVPIVLIKAVLLYRPNY